MQFSKFATYFEKIENTSSRLSITELLAELFDSLHDNEIDKAIYLLQGRLTPLYQRLDFGMAEKMVLKSAAEALQIDMIVINKKYKELGDLGRTVEFFKEQQPSLHERNLSITDVYDVLYVIAQSTGPGSQEKKIQALAGLMSDLDVLSCRYIARIPVGVLRLGFSDMTVLDAFSWMIKKDKTLRPLIEKAYHVRPDLGLLGKILKQKGVTSLDNMNPAIFTPIIMMRAERTSSGDEIIAKIGKCAIEPKYDGFRLQIHYQKKGNDKEVRLYSRNLDDVSYMYPDIVEGVKKEIKADQLIFEGEAIGFDPHTNNFLPFQETVQRKRKHGIEEKAKEIPLKLFAFELLYADGINYISTPYEERRKELQRRVKLTGDVFADTVLLAPENIVEDGKKLELLFDEAVAKGLEGIMAKKLTGVYQPGARGSNWIKLKRSYSSKIDDTIDCLVMGYDYGKGKRVEFGIGAFLVGVYDEENDKYVTMAKIGTGLTDEEWRELKKRGDHFLSEKKPPLYEVDKMMEVDAWVRPEIVVEIKADEITKSPVHTAGRVLKPSKSGTAFEVETPGFALRFPRLQKFRDDKRPEEITTLKEIEEMFQQTKK